MKKRIFLAINLPKEVKEKIASFSLILGKNILKEGIKFTEKNNLHITLHFLGDQNEHRIGEIAKISVAVAEKFTPFEISIDKLIAFPNEKFPRIIALGRKKENREIQLLRAKLGERLKDLAIEIDERPWKGHVTLARIKYGKIDFSELQKEIFKELKWKVESFDLVESQLTNEGPIYNVIKTFKI